MADFDLIEDAHLEEGNRSPGGASDDVVERTPNPIKVRGVGHLTLFGFTNKFDPDFPSGLTAKLAPEEYNATLHKVNCVLGRTLPLNLRWLMCGCICCCCTMGLSMWPVVYLNKRTRNLLEKILDAENCNFYHKLGLHWKLQKQMVNSSNMMEYVLLIEFRPKLALLKPD